MSRYRFELATTDDDADLRHILAATPMDGRIALAFRREPSWFAGAVVDGRSRQVVACRDTHSGRIIGFGCRSIREVYVNGQPASVGYLSSLRVLPDHRNLGLVARGYAFFRELHGDKQAPFYLTTIADGNRTALDVLTSRRAGLPAYHLAGMYHTVAIALPRRRTMFQSKNVTVRPASLDDLPAILQLLGSAGPRRQFFPRFQASDFLSPNGAMRGLTFDSILLAERADQLVGILAGWDQRGDRQAVVEAYRGSLRWLGPIYNAWAWLNGSPGLPRPGQPFSYLTGALPVVMGDDDNIIAALLETLRGRAAGGPWTHLLLGLHEADPMLRVIQRFQAACYQTRVFLVCWPDGDAARLAVDQRIPYLEAGSL